MLLLTSSVTYPRGKTIVKGVLQTTWGMSILLSRPIMIERREKCHPTTDGVLMRALLAMVWEPGQFTSHVATTRAYTWFLLRSCPP